jgi:arginyl-tRNA synthetase
MSHCEDIYRALGVDLSRADLRGESAYNNDLDVVVADLQGRGMAVTSEGAQVVLLNEFENKDGDPAAYIVRKRDGGYLYPTSDLAAIRYRVSVLKAEQATRPCGNAPPSNLSRRLAIHRTRRWSIP